MSELPNTYTERIQKQRSMSIIISHNDYIFFFVSNIMTDYINIGKKDDDDDTHTSSLLMSAQQSFLSSAKYSSPNLNSSLILTPSGKN